MGWSGQLRRDVEGAAARFTARDRARGKCRDCGAPVTWVTYLRGDGTTAKRPLHPTPSVDGRWVVQANDRGLFAAQSPMPNSDPGKYIDHRDICPGKDAA